MGIGRTLARSRTARPQAGLRHAARARAQLRRVVRRFHRRHQGLRRRRSTRDGRLRLAAVGKECLEGRADAARLAAPAAHPLAREDCRDAPEVSPLSRGTRLQAVEILQGAGAVDAASARVCAARLNSLNSQFPTSNAQPFPTSNLQCPITLNLGVGIWEWLGVGSWELIQVKVPDWPRN